MINHPHLFFRFFVLISRTKKIPRLYTFHPSKPSDAHNGAGNNFPLISQRHYLISMIMSPSISQVQGEPISGHERTALAGHKTETGAVVVDGTSHRPEYVPSGQPVPVLVVYDQGHRSLPPSSLDQGHMRQPKHCLLAAFGHLSATARARAVRCLHHHQHHRIASWSDMMLLLLWLCWASCSASTKRSRKCWNSTPSHQHDG